MTVMRILSPRTAWAGATDDDGDGDVLEFAKDALARMSDITGRLGGRKQIFLAGSLAAEYMIAKKALESANANQLPRLQRRLPRLLDDLERVCAWPHPPEPFNPILRAVVNSKSYLDVQKAEDCVSKGITEFAKTSPYVRDQYLKKLKRFSQSVLAEEDDKNAKPTKDKNTPSVEEYPGHVDARLHAVLRSHSLCTCSSSCRSGRKRHHARLRLRDEIVKVDEYVAFDMLFSGSPTAWDHWQDLQLRVSMKKPSKKKAVRHWGEESQTKAVANARAKSRVVSPDSFCKLVKTRLGSRICCHIQDSELHQLYDGYPLSQKFDPEPSLSLRKVLETARLSNRMKLILAYILARSFWQYYDSPWMESEWSSDSIHFLRETPLDDDSSGSGLYASRPYFAVEFEDQPDTAMVEYCDAFGVIFRYPRLLSLCLMLLEIGRGQSLSIEDYGSLEMNLNETWTLAKRLTNSGNAWGDFDYPDYRKAILGCLHPALASGESIDAGVFARKTAVYESVVQPLHRLLTNLGYAENLNIPNPIDTSSGPGKELNIPAAPVLHEPEHQTGQSTQWLEGMHKINDFVKGVRKIAANQQRQPSVRVAVLDTGIDNETAFFDAPVRRRKIKGWRDWMEHSDLPVDENGHGTHTVSLLMKVAPMADIYVARIVKDRGNLKSSAGAIAEAIHWAANEVKADIVSMSFGFQEEQPAITRAITEATLQRENKIIFFAAASNSGGNMKEMFPANIDSVISVRETNSLGAFSDTNPPVDPDGPAAFGTLGRDVPSAWLSSVHGEVPKSGSSVATGVAAGIAAMMLGFVRLGMADPQARLPLELNKVYTRRGMQAVLAKMSLNMGNRSYFISPWGFFSGKDANMAWTAIADACMSK